MSKRRETDVRGFGLVMAAASCLGAWRWRGELGVVVALLALGALVLVLSFAAPRVVRPLARAWMALGHALGRVTTPVLLAVVFLTVVIPLRVLLAVFRADPLRLRLDPKAKSYFETRKRPRFDKDDFERLA